MDKKAAVLIPLFIVGFLIGAGTWAVTKAKTDNLSFSYSIGDLSLAQLRAASSAKKAQVFVDTAAERAAKQAVRDLAENGGLTSSECGSFKGYQLWNSRNQDCIPDKATLHQNLETFMDRHLHDELSTWIDPPDFEYFTNNRNTLELHGIPLQNFHFELTAFELGNKITFRVQEKPVTNFQSTEETAGVISTKPSFAVKTTDIIDEFTKAAEIVSRQFLFNQVESCESDASPQLTACLTVALAKLSTDQDWRINCDGVEYDDRDRIVPLCIETDKTILVFNEHSEHVEEQPLFIKLALYFP